MNQISAKVAIVFGLVLPLLELLLLRVSGIRYLLSIDRI
jgi:hypothetical protein